MSKSNVELFEVGSYLLRYIFESKLPANVSYNVIKGFDSWLLKVHKRLPENHLLHLKHLRQRALMLIG